MEIIIVILLFIIAVWYLYRRYKNIVNPGSAACGCGGCDCGAGAAANNRKEHAREND